MNPSENRENYIHTWRLLLFYGAIALVFGFYVFRLFSYQILDPKRYQEAALENRHTTLKVPTSRGIIYDRNNFVLARNVASYNVVITPANLPDDEGSTQEIYRELASLIDVPAIGPTPDDNMAKNFTPCITDQLAISQAVYIQDNLKPYTPVQIKCNIAEKIARVIREKAADWPGVEVEIQPIREYPTGSLTSEIIGFLGPISAEGQNAYPDKDPRVDKIGYAGVESWMQLELGGTNA